MTDTTCILLDEQEFLIKNNKKALFIHHRIIHIQSPKDDEYGEVLLFENTYIRISGFHGSIQDQYGKIQKKFSRKDLLVSTFSPGFVLYDDTKRSWFKPESNIYPYLLEYEVEYDYRSLFYWPDWSPQEEIPVYRSTYKLTLQEPVKFKFYPHGISAQPDRKIEDGDSVYFWSMDSIPERSNEAMRPMSEQHLMTVFFAPNDFFIDNYPGSNTSWSSFGNWYALLAADCYKLPSSAVLVVDSIRTQCSSSRQIIEKLYSYLQSRTRYVAVSLGIGGYQPHSAASVYTNCYGDCKDLTTLMIAMLQQAEIPAYPALALMHDGGKIFKEFSSNQFNHVITCVPLGTDTIWLETTVDHLSAGEMHWGIEGCDVLLVKENESQLVQTPQSLSQDNLWRSSIHGFLTSTGILDFSATIYLTGNQKHDMYGTYRASKPSDFKEWFNKLVGRYSLNPDITSFGVRKDSLNNHPSMVIDFKGKFRNTGVFSSSRLFLNPNLLNQKTVSSLPDKQERKYPIELDYPYLDLDSVSIRLPFGYSLESGPPPCFIQTTFGNYSTGYSIHDGIFNYYRRFEYTEKVIPVEQYGDYVNFLKAIVQKDQTRFVFKK